MKSILKSLKLLTDPTRLRILNVLNEESLSVAELQEVLNMGQSRISTQLAQLKKEGLVMDARVGKNVFYTSSLNDKLRDVAAAACCELPEVEQDRAALRFVLEKRKDRLRSYFDDVAGKFGRNYAPGRSWKALAGGLLRIMNYEVIADLGAGEGFVSQLLSARARHVIAVDNSPRMVALGAEMVKQHGLSNLEYRLGDIENPPIEPNSVDLAMFSQALHHAVSPDRALQATWNILKPGGCLLVLDLLSHKVEEARDLYADIWLGFTESQLEHMMLGAGFEHVYTDVVDKEGEAPYFQTLMGVAWKPAAV